MIIVNPPEQKKIIKMCDPYQIIDKDGWHWADNTPQHIKDKWKEHVEWKENVRREFLVL